MVFSLTAFDSRNSTSAVKTVNIRFCDIAVGQGTCDFSVLRVGQSPTASFLYVQTTCNPGYAGKQYNSRIKYFFYCMYKFLHACKSKSYVSSYIFLKLDHLCSEVLVNLTDKVPVCYKVQVALIKKVFICMQCHNFLTPLVLCMIMSRFPYIIYDTHGNCNSTLHQLSFIILRVFPICMKMSIS